MSLLSIPEKRNRTNSFSDSFEISDLSFAPTPPLHKHARSHSALSGSTDPRSSSTSSFLKGSVIWNKSSSSGPLRYPSSSSRTSTPSEFSSSHASSMPLDFSSLESSGHSWSPSSSSFQTSSSATLNESVASKRPRYLSPSSSSRASCYPRPLETSQSSRAPANSGVHTSTTLPPIPGYGPIRLTVTMDLPPPVPHHHHQRHHSDYTNYMGPRVDTPFSEVPPTLHPEGSLDSALEYLSQSELRQLLRLAVQKNPSFASDITSEYTHKASTERNRTVNFVHYSNSVWHTLNAKQTADTEAQQQETAETAIKNVSNDIIAVTQQVRRESSLATKKNALETLRKIGRNICMAPGIAGEKAREYLGRDGKFVDAVAGVLGCFTQDDRRTIWAGGSGAEIVKRLEQLDELSRYHGVFDGFEAVLKVLKREDESGMGP